MALHEVHLRSRRPLRVPFLTKDNREKRLLWAQKHVQCGDVLFTDESIMVWFVLLFKNKNMCNVEIGIPVWRQPGNVNSLNPFLEVHPFRGGTIMVWVNISIGRRTDLILLEENMTTQIYVEQIILPAVVAYAGAVFENFHFMPEPQQFSLPITVASAVVGYESVRTSLG
ncbi:Transposase [Popillia japonica]|uniref:Transposase n=1 Tax=Popillia japonica TaxID=7064 RepID=A0AAW1N3J4_POPJA